MAQAKATVASAASKLQTASQTLDQLSAQLEQANADLAAQESGLAAARKTADQTCTKLGSGSAECVSAKQKIDALQPDLLQARNTLKLLQGDGSWEHLAAQKEVLSAQAAYDAAAAQLKQVQAARSVPLELIQAQTTYDAAVSALTSARAKLDQARVGATNADLVAAQSGLDQARAGVQSAQAKLDQTLEGATDADVVSAQATLDTAQANLSAAQTRLATLGQATPQDLQAARMAAASAQAGLVSAQAKLDQLQAGPKATDIALQQEAVRQAELAVRQAQINLEDAILVAPFDGVVAAINAKVGEQAPGGGDAVQVLTNQRDVRTDTTVDRSERPVVAFYGSVPLYRTLHDGVEGADVRQLEENLAELGYTGLTADGTYTSAVAMAVRKWQADLGLPETGTVEPGQVVFTPGPVRIAEDTARVGDAIGGNSGASVAAGSARPSEAGASGRGVAVLSYTGATKLVTVQLGVADQALAVVGRKAAVSVPGQQAVEGQISQVDSVLTAASTTPVPSGPSSAASAARIKVDVAIADQEALGSLGGAPVDVDFVVDERKDVLAVPVAALLAMVEGGFGVEIVDGDTTRIVAVRTGMFAGGRVEVSGEGIADGMTVGVPK